MISVQRSFRQQWHPICVPVSTGPCHQVRPALLGIACGVFGDQSCGSVHPVPVSEDLQSWVVTCCVRSFYLLSDYETVYVHFLTAVPDLEICEEIITTLPLYYAIILYNKITGRACELWLHYLDCKVVVVSTCSFTWSAHLVQLRCFAIPGNPPYFFTWACAHFTFRFIYLLVRNSGTVFILLCVPFEYLLLLSSAESLAHYVWLSVCVDSSMVILEKTTTASALYMRTQGQYGTSM